MDIFQEFAIQPVVHPCDCVLEEVWTGPAERDNPELAAYITLADQRLRRLPYAQLCAGQADPLRIVAFTSEESIRQLFPAVISFCLLIARDQPGQLWLRRTGDHASRLLKSQRGSGPGRLLQYFSGAGDGDW